MNIIFIMLTTILIKPFLPSVLLDKILSVFEIRELSINEQSKQEINYDHLKEPYQVIIFACRR